MTPGNASEMMRAFDLVADAIASTSRFRTRMLLNSPFLSPFAVLLACPSKL